MYITVEQWLGVQMGAMLIHHSGTVAGGTDGGNVDTCTSQWQWLGVQMGQRDTCTSQWHSGWGSDEGNVIHVHHSGTLVGGTDGGNVDTCTSQWHTGWGYRWRQR